MRRELGLVYFSQVCTFPRTGIRSALYIARQFYRVKWALVAFPLLSQPVVSATTAAQKRACGNSGPLAIGHLS